MNVTSACNAAWAARIRATVSDLASDADWDRARAHLRTCAECRAHYDEVAAVVSRVEGHPGRTPEAVAERLEAELFARLDRADEADESPARLSPPTTRGWGWAALGAAAAAVAVAIAVVPGQTDAPVARGGDPGSTFGLRVFCIDRSIGEPVVRATATAGETRLARCHRGERLQVTYSAGAAGHLHLARLGPSGEVAWLWPVEGDGRIDAGADRALPGTFEVGRGHGDGRVAIVALFKPSPPGQTRGTSPLDGLSALIDEASAVTWLEVSP